MSEDLNARLAQRKELADQIAALDDAIEEDDSGLMQELSDAKQAYRDDPSEENKAAVLQVKQNVEQYRQAVRGDRTLGIGGDAVAGESTDEETPEG